MLLDTSGSMARSMFYLQIAASSFLANLRENDRVALFSFGCTMKELAPFTKDKSLLMTQIDSLYPEGGTPLYDAIARGMKVLRRVRGRKAQLVFTDGAAMSLPSWRVQPIAEEPGVDFFAFLLLQA
jgi:Mg-chelatase subunit ChlD